MSEYSKDRVTKTVQLNLDGVDVSEWAAVKEEVGAFIVESILDKVGDGKSPVKNQKDFKKLSVDYASEFKKGDRLPNLDLTGGMLDSLTFINKPNDEIEVGITNPLETKKALGHNTGFDGKRKDLIRRFIPRKSQEFDSEIKDGVKRIVNRYKTQTPDIGLEQVDSFLDNALGLGVVFGESVNSSTSDDDLMELLRQLGAI